MVSRNYKYILFLRLPIILIKANPRILLTSSINTVKYDKIDIKSTRRTVSYRFVRLPGVPGPNWGSHRVLSQKVQRLS